MFAPLYEKHWDVLRQSTTDLGLDEFIAPHPAETLRRAQCDDGESILTFEPLTWGLASLLFNALTVMGIAVAATIKECPVCALAKEHTETCTDPECKMNYDDWPRSAAIAARAEADRRLGTVVAN